MISALKWASRVALAVFLSLAVIALITALTAPTPSDWLGLAVSAIVGAAASYAAGELLKDLK